MTPRGLISRILPTGGASSTWIVTFTDLICLMLTFFVMLFAMAEPDVDNLRTVAIGIPGVAPVRKTGEAVPGAPFNVGAVERETALDLGYLGRVLELHIRESADLQGVVLTRRGNDLILALPGDLLFDPGSARLTDAGLRSLGTLSAVLRNIGNAVDLVGHTDPSPVSVSFPSNWELSLARAQAVALALRRAGYQRSVTVRGQADGRFAEVVPWRPEEERKRLSRRVDLVIREHRSGQ